MTETEAEAFSINNGTVKLSVARHKLPRGMPCFLAKSKWRPDVEEFWTQGAAVHWLWIVDGIHESQRIRAGHRETLAEA